MGDCALNHKNLPEYVTYLRENHIEGWYSIPADGFRLQKPERWHHNLERLHQAGTEILEFTLYGKETTHDWFAGFKGSYMAIYTLADLWHQLGGQTEWGVVLHQRNLSEVSEIRADVYQRFGAACPVALWDYLGWGTSSESLRIDRAAFSQLESAIQGELSAFKSEQEWIEELREAEFAPFSASPRVQHLAINSTGAAKLPYTTAANGHNGPLCGQLPQTSAREILEKHQQQYHSWQASYPSMGELCQKFGDLQNTQLYNQRSILRKWGGLFEQQASVCTNGLP